MSSSLLSAVLPGKQPEPATHAEMIFDDMDVLATLIKHSLPSLSTLVDSCSAMNRHASLQASRYPVMTVVGWILFRTSSFARRKSSEARSTTEVVPSPTSLSCCVASETRIRA